MTVSDGMPLIFFLNLVSFNLSGQRWIWENIFTRKRNIIRFKTGAEPVGPPIRRFLSIISLRKEIYILEPFPKVPEIK